MKMPKDIVTLTASHVESSASITVYASRVEAGFPTPAEDYEEGKLDLNQYLIANPPATFFVRVSGDSMLHAGIHSGDLLIVDRSLEPVSGKIIIAVLNGELTVKRLKIDKAGQVILWPENPKYEPIPVTPEMDFRVWGVVTAVVHRV